MEEKKQKELEEVILNNESAILDFKKAIELSKRESKTAADSKAYMAESYFNIGVVKEVMELNEEAIENYQKCLNIVDEVDLKRFHLKFDYAKVYSRLAELFNRAGDLDKAIEFYDKQINFMEKVRKI